jgi:LacI family transcriptional regulator
MNGRVTQTDIAKRAGVHSTTVSLALRNHPSLPAETRKRLQDLAEAMGYRPDPDLRALMVYRQSVHAPKTATTLAYVTNWETQWGWKDFPAHAEFYAGAMEKASALGYRLDHFWLGEPGLTDQRMSDILRARGITGVVIASHLPHVDRPLALDWSRLSAVKIDFHPSKPHLHNVTNDQCAIIRLAMRQMIAAGYRRIGFVIPAWFDDFVDQAWCAGFLVEQQRLDPLERIPILLYPGNTVQENGGLVPASVFNPWFNRFRPEAIVSWGPFVLPRLAELGLTVPRDVAYADVFLDRGDGKTAGVRQNCRRVGELAIEILAGQLQHHIFGIPPFPTVSLVEGTWFDGATLPQAASAEKAVPRVSRQPSDAGVADFANA